MSFFREPKSGALREKKQKKGVAEGVGPVGEAHGRVQPSGGLRRKCDRGDERFAEHHVVGHLLVAARDGNFVSIRGVPSKKCETISIKRRRKPVMAIYRPSWLFISRHCHMALWKDIYQKKRNHSVCACSLFHFFS